MPGRVALTIRVGPPVDLIFGRCTLSDDQLELTLLAHPDFDVARISLAVRTVPGDGLLARTQVADEIKWGEVQNGQRRNRCRGRRRMEQRLSPILPPGVYLRYVGRPQRVTPSEGYSSAHTIVQARIVAEALSAGSSPVKARV